MATLLVVDNPTHWPHDLRGAELVAARAYLTQPRFNRLKRAKVFNLCRSYGYQEMGYYVSLLATARGHKPLPSVTTIEDLKQAPILKIASDMQEELIQRALQPIKSDTFALSIYFGRNLAKRYDRLSQALFEHFPAPLLRAEFSRSDVWRLTSIKPIATNEIPESHWPFVHEQAGRFFARPRATQPKKSRYEMAILVNPNEADAPSDEKAIKRFIRAGASLGIRAWTISRQEYGRLGEYDALFIRETTRVNHHTYRFARRAEADGLVVMDDPESIIRCTNKVYQAEVFEKNAIPCPKTLVVHRENADEVGDILGFPCVLKRPDSSFSAGVVKAKNEQELHELLSNFLNRSELVVAQAFAPSEFDWRVGVLDGQPLYVCKYFMARGHWQIQRTTESAKRSYGKHLTLDVADAPANVIDIALRAARAMGNGLYGVDLKACGDEILVMEVNDNPSINAGVEDLVLKDELYLAIMRSFYNRLETRHNEDAIPHA